MTARPGAARDLALSDTKNDTGFSWVMVTGTAGSVIVNQVGGNQTTLASVPIGVWVPVGQGTNVRIASTAVGIMVA